jgi:hypothetical protein
LNRGQLPCAQVIAEGKIPSDESPVAHGETWRHDAVRRHSSGHAHEGRRTGMAAAEPAAATAAPRFGRRDGACDAETKYRNCRKPWDMLAHAHFLRT